MCPTVVGEEVGKRLGTRAGNRTVEVPMAVADSEMPETGNPVRQHRVTTKKSTLFAFNYSNASDRGQELSLCRADFFSRAASAASVRQGAINYYNNQTIQSNNHCDRRNRERTRHASLVQPHKGGARARR